VEAYLATQKRTKKSSYFHIIFDDQTGRKATLPVKTHDRYKKRGKALAAEIPLAGVIFNGEVIYSHPWTCCSEFLIFDILQ
jgi:hypothetical protein